MFNSTELRKIIARKQAARERLRKAHITSTHAEFNAAGAEWTAAFAAYINR